MREIWNESSISGVHIIVLFSILAEDVNHTFGPLDGSIYATITKKPELSPGAVSSPLTVSMDSGISSAGKQIKSFVN